jgi:hypothetical protein
LRQKKKKKEGRKSSQQKLPSIPSSLEVKANPRKAAGPKFLIEKFKTSGAAVKERQGH